MAEHENTVVGATFFLVWGSTLYYKFNASLSDTLNLRPNDLLTWRGIQFGQAAGLQLLDFGQSDLDQEGLLRYKEKYATERGRSPPTSHSNSLPRPPAREWGTMLTELTTLFVSPSVPNEIYERAGDLLYRQFC